jgi:hypothetical protein
MKRGVLWFGTAIVPAVNGITVLAGAHVVVLRRPERRWIWQLRPPGLPCR